MSTMEVGGEPHRVPPVVGAHHARVDCLGVVREQLGGKLMIAVTGGSHTAPEVLDFISKVMSDGNEAGVHDSCKLMRRS